MREIRSPNPLLADASDPQLKDLQCGRTVQSRRANLGKTQPLNEVAEEQ